MLTVRQWVWLEVFANTFTGLLGSWLITYYCISFVPTPATAASLTTVICTIWSILRGYVFRRWFTTLIHKHGLKHK